MPVPIGRDREIAQLRGFMAACQNGPCALAIEGEAGTGKTVLFDAAMPWPWGHEVGCDGNNATWGRSGPPPRVSVTP